MKNRYSVDGADRYYRDHLDRGDADVTPGDAATRPPEAVPGVWRGLAAERLGLRGPMRREDFLSVLDADLGRFGLGDRPRNSKVKYIDAVFSPPKSASLAAVLDPRVGDLYRRAVENGVDRMERAAAARDRRGDLAGEEVSRPTGSLCAGMIVHETSRAGDPNLHIHVVIANLTWDEGRRQWLALDAAGLYQGQKLFDAAVHTDFAAGLRELGYHLRAEAGGFEVEGIPATALDRFSARRAEVLAQEARLAADPGLERDLARRFGMGGRLGGDGRLGPGDRRELAATSSRPAKAAATRAGTRERMEAMMEPGERKALEATVDAARARGSQLARGTERDRRAGLENARAAAAREAVDRTLEAVFRKECAVPADDLLRQALDRCGDGRCGAGEVGDELARRERAGGLIRRVRDGRHLVTTGVAMAMERECVAAVLNGNGKFRPLGRVHAGSGPRVSPKDPEGRRERLTDEQAKAVDTVVGSTDGVTLLVGAAGTGKTTVLRTIAADVRAAGTTVFAFAPTSKAGRTTLREAGFPEAETIQKFLKRPGLQARAAGGLVVVDEAGLVGSGDMRELLRLSEAGNFRVLLVGDTAQNAPVQGAQMLKVLEDHAGLGDRAAKLLEVHRQRDPAYREAVKCLDRGSRDDAPAATREGLERLDRLGWVREIADRGELLETLASDYATYVVGGEPGAKRGRTALCVAPTHVAVGQVNAAVRAALVRTGFLGGRERPFDRLRASDLRRESERGAPYFDERAARGQAARYRPGMVIEFRENVAGFRTGDRAVVESVGTVPNGRVVLRRTGETMALAEKSFREVARARKRARDLGGTQRQGDDWIVVRVPGEKERWFTGLRHRPDRPPRDREELPLGRPEAFAVFEVDRIALRPGDKVRLTAAGVARLPGLDLSKGSRALRGFKGALDASLPALRLGRAALGSVPGLERVVGRARGTPEMGDPARPRVDLGTELTYLGRTLGGDLRFKEGVRLPADFGHLAHGYCITMAVSQGDAADKVFALMTTDGGPAVNARTAYVVGSRGRDEIQIYADNKKEVFEMAGRPSGRLSATDVVTAPSDAERRGREAVLALKRDVERKVARGIIPVPAPTPGAAAALAPVPLPGPAHGRPATPAPAVAAKAPAVPARPAPAPGGAQPAPPTGVPLTSPGPASYVDDLLAGNRALVAAERAAGHARAPDHEREPSPSPGFDD